ncbi:MAG: hypothetical protein Rubg2KO_40270 [Rubricoccaceae bacterium]
MKDLELIAGLLEQLDGLRFDDDAQLDAFLRRGDMVIRNLFGAESHHLDSFNRISFSPFFYPTTSHEKRESFRDGVERTRNLLNTISEERMLFGQTAEELKSEPSNGTAPQGNSVFIVHGHDEAMKQSVARTIEKLGLDPIILHERPSQGRTIIEKFSDHADVHFAVVLLSPDDIGYARDSKPDKPTYRARQNVIFELGYFIGRLGRDRVLALHKTTEDFEMPSDYSGVLFVPFDTAARWQFDLAKEMKACGYDIDINQLLS